MLIHTKCGRFRRYACITVLTSLCAPAFSQLNSVVFPTTGFVAGDAGGVANTSTVPNLAFTGDVAWAPPYSSVRFSGRLTSAQDDMYSFVAATDGALRVWIDDHLIIDDFLAAGFPRSVFSVYNMPLVAGQPVPIRVEYIHNNAGPASLTLQWAGNFTSQQVVPASAFDPTVAPAEVQRQALRDSFLSPSVPWQTWDVGNMAGHVHVPSGFSLQATLGDTRDLSSTGPLRVFAHNDPARVRMGPHSYNGSSYTEMTVDRWGARNASVLLQSTVNGQDLMILATCTGSDCPYLVLVVQPMALFGRVCAISGNVPGVFVAQCPGFKDITTFSASGGGVWFLTDSFVYFALPLNGSSQTSASVGYATGRFYSLSTIAASIATAQAAMQQYLATRVPAALAPLYEGMQTVCAWNTILSAINSVFTPISRSWAWGPEHSLVFDWDNLFVAYMMSIDGGIAKDIAYNNIIEVIQGRTLEGFVPNFWEGISGSSDRSEPQLGSAIVLRVYQKWQDAWLLEKVFDALFAWNTWTWTRRQAVGGKYPNQGLIVLGSDPNQPPSDSNTNTLNGARLESGQDNSPMYDGVDNGLGPVTFDPHAHHMELYEVGQTALFIADCAALTRIAEIVNRTDVMSTLQQRQAASNASLNTVLWNGTLGSYVNVLYSGAAYPRFGMTYFYPLFAGAASAQQAESLVTTYLTSPQYFCVTQQHRGPAGTAMLVRFWDSTRNVSFQGVSSSALRSAIDDGRYGYTSVEALLANATNVNDTVAVCLWYAAAYGTYAIATCGQAPTYGGASYTLVSQEGAISSTNLPGRVALTVWYAAATHDVLVCGSAACVATANASGYAAQGTLGYALSASEWANLPCKFGVPPSIARSDPAFGVGDGWYWRGRFWGPHAQILYWGLQQYSASPAIAAARQVLVQEAASLFLQDWTWFRHVNENSNPVTGIGSDNNSADPAYHWGALFGFLSLLEAGLY